MTDPWYGVWEHDETNVLLIKLCAPQEMQGSYIKVLNILIHAELSTEHDNQGSGYVFSNDLHYTQESMRKFYKEKS